MAPSPAAAREAAPAAAREAAPVAAVSPVSSVSSVVSPFAAPAVHAPLLDEREQAIEVAAMLGDSVVALQHVAVPTAERKLAARWWFAIAGASALLAIIAFALTVRVAAKNDEAFHRWLAQKRPAYAFRPELVGAEYDAAGFAGLALALGAAVMGVVRLRQARLRPLFRIGTAPDVELPMADAPAASFPLVSERAGKLVVQTTGAMGGEIVVDNAVVSLAELAAQGRARALGDGGVELQMPASGRARLRCGNATLLLSAVPRPSQQVPLAAGSFDQRTLAYIAGALAVHLVLGALIRLVPEDATVASANLEIVEDVGMRTASTSNDTKPEEPEQGQTGSEASGATTSSDAMKLPSGKAGDPAEAAENRRLQIKRSESSDQQARMEAIDRAQRSGILGSSAMRERNWGAIMGADGNLAGLDETTMFGNLYGDEVGAAGGNFGGGPSGIGPGGGGDGIIGTKGNYNTIGTFPGGGNDIFGGSCRGPGPCRGLRDRTSAVPGGGVTFKDPQCGPNGCGLDKAIIRRYVKRNMEKIRYCYEMQLLANPSLEGTVMSSFIISPTGGVMSSKASGVDDKVAACVASVVGAIAFPRPGDAVQVNYPFTFRHP